MSDELKVTFGDRIKILVAYEYVALLCSESIVLANMIDQRWMVPRREP